MLADGAAPGTCERALERALDGGDGAALLRDGYDHEPHRAAARAVVARVPVVVGPEGGCALVADVLLRRGAAAAEVARGFARVHRMPAALVAQLEATLRSAARAASQATPEDAAMSE